MVVVVPATGGPRSTLALPTENLMQIAIVVAAAVFGTVLGVPRHMRPSLLRLRLGPSRVDLEAWTVEAMKVELVRARPLPPRRRVVLTHRARGAARGLALRLVLPALLASLTAMGVVLARRETEGGSPCPGLVPGSGTAFGREAAKALLGEDEETARSPIRQQTEEGIRADEKLYDEAAKRLDDEDDAAKGRRAGGTLACSIASMPPADAPTPTMGSSPPSRAAAVPARRRWRVWSGPSSS
jgi:hypothetical protein